MSILSFHLLLRLAGNVQVDLQLLALEVVVELVGSPSLRFAVLRVGEKHFGFAQDLQSWLDVLICQLGCSLQLFVFQLIDVIEQKENRHLICGDLESVGDLT